MPVSDLETVKKQFEYYKSLGEKTFAQLKDEDLFYEHNEHSNSIAVTVNHLSGNMLSRWTNFLTTDGEKEWRNRDREFESIIKDREQLLEAWNKGWDCVFTALDSVNEANYDTTVYIRNQAHSIMDAALRQLAHYAYHIGQIVYVGRMLTEDWSSLSIPKGGSAGFNQTKFSKGKHGGHFTDDIK
ncbi:DUF1572 family protein [Roseivirga misakiensis]|uniref:DUF1572 domain-containing protein n=1 Tax=Roseivirga misakiensis TaxID=1563681 RepID=A0A1E5SYV7_9BACT|nr:DUF1572 family protein [Roseivirga misakiensis]OEK04296.1 hypothetical protein BFP71_12495 [Roseivirga misakiensis]